MRLYILVLTGILSFSWINAQADSAPVIDLNDLPDSSTPSSSTDITDTPAPSADPVSARQTLPMDQRVRLLEQQISNFTQMNLPAKVDNLEQQIHQLNGQLEEQTHTIQQLQDQLQKQSASSNTSPSIPTPISASIPTSKTTQQTSSTTNVPTNTPAHHTDKTVETIKENGNSINPILTAETAVVENKAIASTSTNTENSAEKSYQTAFDLMVKKQTTQAIAAFKVFLNNYPNNAAYTPSAHYWLGELYTTSNKTALASKEFTTVIQQYPTHAKTPDAILKLAIIHDGAGQQAQAKQELQKLIAQFPDSSAAKLAKMRLKGMKSNP